MPHLFVEQLRKIHDRGGETPPAGSEPATPPIVAEWAEALNQGDLDRARALLAEEFRCESPQLGKTFRRDRYLRALRALHRLFPRVSYSVREVREAAGELWVRVEMEARPRRGDPIVADAWEAWRVEGGRILEIRQGRVLEVSP